MMRSCKTRIEPGEMLYLSGSVEYLAQLFVPFLRVSRLQVKLVVFHPRVVQLAGQDE